MELTIEQRKALALAAARKRQQGRGSSMPDKSYAEREYDKAIVGAQGMVEGLPIVGPYLKDASESAAGTVSSWITGRPKEELLEEYRERQEERLEQNPTDHTVGQVAGGIAPFLGVGIAPKAVQSALGMTGKLGARMLKGGASGGVLSGADHAARDFANDGSVTSGEVGISGGIGAGLGAAIPFVGTVGGKAIGAIAGKTGNAVRSVANPSSQAARRVSQALERDRSSGLNTLSQADVSAAQRNSQPIMNADLGGETTRALTRAVANQSPDARGAIQRVVQDRFSTQGNRLSEKIRELAGDADDLGAIELIRRNASASNKPAYLRAFSSTNARALYTERLQELMQSPAFRSAVNSVPKRSADRGAVEGFKQIDNPFARDADGSFVLMRRVDGSTAIPNLEFWNQVKINLDAAIDRAKRSEGRTRVAELMALKNALVDELDRAVPAYQTARQGAAAYFQAEDAVDAGRKFFKSSRMMPEFRKGILKMTPDEREAFKVGFASEILDAAGNTPDGQNVIRRYFSSPDSREKINLAFGAAKAKEFEAFVRVENAMDMLRGAMGNSTTTRQLIESGIGGIGLGGATWLYTGDAQSTVAATLVGVAGRSGARAAGRKINENVMRQTADLLLSNDPKAIERAVKMAARSPQHMAAVDAIAQMTGLAARGAAYQSSAEQR